MTPFGAAAYRDRETLFDKMCVEMLLGTVCHVTYFSFVFDITRWCSVDNDTWRWGHSFAFQYIQGVPNVTTLFFHYCLSKYQSAICSITYDSPGLAVFLPITIYLNTALIRPKLLNVYNDRFADSVDEKKKECSDFLDTVHSRWVWQLTWLYMYL